MGPCAYGVGWLFLSAAQRWQHEFCSKGLKLACSWAPRSPTKLAWVSWADLVPPRGGGVLETEKVYPQVPPASPS